MRVRPAVRSMKPYVPGASIEAIQNEFGLTDVEKLNQNENALGPSPLAMEAAAAALNEAHLYPEGPAPRLRERLGELWDLLPNWLLVGNGSDEIFRLLAEVYLEARDRVVVPQPSFAGYPLVAELMDTDLLCVPLDEWAMDVDAMAQTAAEADAAMLFLCRPNSPTGAVFSESAFRQAMEIVPETTIVVLDEAYQEFDESGFRSRPLLDEYPNLVVTRTFSKLYGMAGLRLGYGVMRPELIEPMLRARDPFSINSIAIAAGLAALDDREHIERTLTMTHQGKRFLYSVFERLDLPFVPTEANFILFDVRRPAGETWRALLQQGILVRPCASFGLPTHLRVTIGTQEQNERFAEALEGVMSRHPVNS